MVFRPPFEDTNLPFEYQTSQVFRWILYSLYIRDSNFRHPKIGYSGDLNTQYVWMLSGGLHVIIG